MPATQPGGAPPLGNWQSYAPATSSTSTSGSNPNDIWGLGKLYDQPVLIGTTDTGGPVSPGSGPAKAELGMGEHVTADTYATTQALMKQATQMWQNNPAQYMALQQQLANAGYYGTTGKTFVPGRYDEATRHALETMLKDYTAAEQSGTPVTLSEFLTQSASATQAAQQAALQAKPPKPTVTTDPTMIRAAAQQAFVAATGHSASEKQIEAFVGQFQTAQQAYETSTNSTVSRPDLSADASAFAQQADPQAYQGHQAEAYTNALVNLLVPGAQRPSIGTVPPA